MDNTDYDYEEWVEKHEKTEEEQLFDDDYRQRVRDIQECSQG